MRNPGMNGIRSHDHVIAMHELYLVSYQAIYLVNCEFKNGKYTAKVGQDNVNIGVVTIFRLANTSLLQVY